MSGRSQLPAPISPFDAIKHSDEQGDYWLAREIAPVLEYVAFQDMESAIRRAMVDCTNSGRNVEEHFQNFRRSPKVSGGSRGPRQTDYRLTRYACRLVVMTSRTKGDVASQARTYFSDKVEEAENAAARVEEAVTIADPDETYLRWRERAVLALMSDGYTAEWASQRVDDIVARNALTHEWSVRGIRNREYAILTDQLHMGAFGLSIEEHKGVKNFPITYKGRKLVYKGDLPPAMTLTELALNTLANSVARELHVQHDSQGFRAVSADVDVAGRIAGDTRRQIEEAIGQPVVSPRNMIQEPDGGLWQQLPPATAIAGERAETASDAEGSGEEDK